MHPRPNRLVSYFFFSNIYLGIIAVALCVETNLLCGLSLNYFPFYAVTFLGTCLYYTMIYVRSVRAKNYNERTVWYRRNLPHVITALRLIIAGVFVFVMVMFLKNRHRLFSLSVGQWGLLFLFPLLAAWYTFSPRIFHLGKIRQQGMVKPFVIGLTWSGFVTVYPVLIWQLQKASLNAPPIFPPVLLWVENFLFISILAIIFDIKDYANDAMRRLPTFPVVMGVRNTLMKVALPLWCCMFAAFVVLQMQLHFSFVQSLLQSIPFALLLVIINRRNQPESLLYYLAGIDGLMLLKAILGILSILFLKQ